MTETFIPIQDTEEFEAFWRENESALDMPRKQAFALACNQCLMIGGGAAPLFRVGFVDHD